MQHEVCDVPVKATSIEIGDETTAAAAVDPSALAVDADTDVSPKPAAEQVLVINRPGDLNAGTSCLTEVSPGPFWSSTDICSILRGGGLKVVTIYFM